MVEGTLLVVDDNKVNREVLSRRLGREGYKVITAGSGREALSLVEQHKISLMLLDLLMPHMSGIEVLEELRRHHDGLELPVLIVSADTDTPQMVAALDQGANDYLTKPIDFELLLAKLRRHLALRTSFAIKARPSQVAINQTVNSFKPGDRLSHYLLGDMIGEGGMGKVFRAQDTRLLRDVAVKVMVGHLAEGTRERFVQEARAVARVSHPGVVTLFDIATEPVPFIAMELLQGQLLCDLGCPLEAPRSTHLVRQVLAALQVVHQAGITHRDLKPSNIMVCPEDRVKVMDFGLAKLDGQDLKLTQTGQIFGTPLYMAPEQLQPERGPVDSQTDIFALAAIFYELVTGALPFAAGSLPKLITEILFKEPISPHDLNPAISDELSLAIMTGLQKEKDLRYKDCQEFLKALEQVH